MTPACNGNGNRYMINRVSMHPICNKLTVSFAMLQTLSFEKMQRHLESRLADKQSECCSPVSQFDFHAILSPKDTFPLVIYRSNSATRGSSDPTDTRSSGRARQVNGRDRVSVRVSSARGHRSAEHRCRVSDALSTAVSSKSRYDDN